MGIEKIFTLGEAAKACGVSQSTIRRKRFELEKHGAIYSRKGWRIPASALLASGFPLDKIDSPSPSHGRGLEGSHGRGLEAPEVVAMRAHIGLLESQLRREQERADRLEAELLRATEKVHGFIEAPRKGFWGRLLGG